MNARAFVLALFAAIGLNSTSAATPQIVDKLIYGGQTYAILQTPMLGLWHHDVDEPPPGKTRAPSFDFESTANWGGYRATWRIADSQLFLDSIQARRDGKPIRDEEILPDEKFPVRAKWFTGRIHLPVGDFDDEKQAFESVLVFEVDRGKVTGVDFHASLPPSHTWNGLPAEPRPMVKVDEIRELGVEGLLGVRLGTVVEVTGKVVPNESRAKADVSEPFFLEIETVDGRRLTKPVRYEYRPPNEEFVSPRVGDTFRFFGYETGGFFGGIDGVKPLVASSGYAFTTTFYLLEGTSRDDLRD